jgi:hypothetical protein
MIAAPVGARGRPFRALAGLLLLLALWLGWRLPLMDARLATLASLLAPQPATMPPVRRRAAVQLPPPARSSAPPPPAVAVPAVAPVSRGLDLQPALPPASAQPVAPPPVAVPMADAAPDPAPAPPDATAFRLADLAYGRLRAGQRRQAAALFDAALAL